MELQLCLKSQSLTMPTIASQDAQWRLISICGTKSCFSAITNMGIALAGKRKEGSSSSGSSFTHLLFTAIRLCAFIVYFDMKEI
jgi:hypothetical protein